ncbi:hypothetical protein [Adhaeretor mobilis]|nr:hypothetical protein [Adhaeretor mobilis]
MSRMVMLQKLMSIGVGAITTLTASLRLRQMTSMSMIQMLFMLGTRSF